MPTRLPVILAALMALTLAACFSDGGSGFGSDGTGLVDTGTTLPTGDGALGSSHPGFREACCTECHDPDSHNTGLAPHECAGCHGANGAPRGHTQETPCAECHDQEHRCADFPDPVSCQTCH